MSNSISRFLRLVTMLLVLTAAMAVSVPVWAAVPSAVTHRLKKVDGFMTKVESALADGKADRNSLGWAQEAMKEIQSQYPDSVGEPEVKAAQERIDKGERDIENLEQSKASAAAEAKSAEQATEATAEAWADKLSAYEADTRPGTKGDYGVPMSIAEDILKARPHYDEAKQLYDEFLATGIDKDSHWKLREAEYDIRVALESYTSSMTRVVEEAERQLKQSGDWLATQKSKSPPRMLGSDRIAQLRRYVADAKSLLSADDPKSQALSEDLASLERMQADIEKIVLKNRRMKPDVYKGKDATSIKSLAKSIVTKQHPGAKIVRVHIISSAWNVESAVEWTDTTKSAVQHRVTKGVNVQVATKQGADCYVHTLFIHKDTIGGATGGLQGHIMFRDKFLEANIPK